ncbi:probable 54S ribosomal protein L24, mitochondrial [Saccharomycodes ludwigii]|uniref:Large ribosomal subunit protein bL28m n=1 Tax=Saccharomycodes ludwigii TaxID=36035 RepID=A0A376B458_9ASCO|nr:probable 54S ribosomal protein L24, mitochondrial [Saccharomycodes ludwigii]
MMNRLTFIRKISILGSPLLREWRLVESRRVAVKPEYKVGDSKPLYVPPRRPEFPDYKYGESKIFKQSNKGLYGGQFIQFGNNVSESKKKVRRRWLPNIIKKGLWSETLNKIIRIKLTTKVYRTITKEGGIDNYLTKDKSARIKELGPAGWKLRYRILTKKEQLSNSPHKDLPVVEKADGSKSKIYYNFSIDGKTYQITVGKRKLLYYLFPLEILEHKADGESLSYKKFISLYQERSTEQILQALSKYGFDLNTISV